LHNCIIDREYLKLPINKVSENPDFNPSNALIFLEEAYSGLSLTTVHEVPTGVHSVKFRKFCYFDYEREAVVNANQTTHDGKR